jgi:hypothetical protein
VHLPRRGSRVDLRGRCYNCLSTSHLVATCRRPTRCLRCFSFGHRAADCSSLPVDTQKQSVWQRLGYVKKRPPARQETSQRAPARLRILVRPPVWQRLSGMDKASPLEGARKASIWRRLATSHDHAAMETTLDSVKQPPLQPKRKRRRSKRRKGAAAQGSGHSQSTLLTLFLTCRPYPLAFWNYQRT